MGFVQPWLLAFGAVALVPLVLHLLGRRRAREVRFSALTFLLAADPKRARALRLEQRSLVALRMAAAAFVALVLARPLLPDWGGDNDLVLGDGPVAVVVVLDDSLSMATREGAQSRLALARDRAAALVANLPAGSRVAVVTSGRPARALHARLSLDVRSVAVDVRAVSPSTHPDDAVRALSLARRLLATADAAERRIVVFSDLQATGWADVALDAPGLRVVQVGARADDTELVSAVVAPGLAGGSQRARVRVTLARHGATPWHGELRLRVGAREVRSHVRVAAGQRMAHVFVVPAVANIAEVSIAAADDHVAGPLPTAEQPSAPQSAPSSRPNAAADAQRLNADAQPGNNRRWVRLGGGQTLRVLIVNGAPRPVPRQDEAFYLVQGLQAGAERSDELRVEVQRPDQLETTEPPNWDVLVLANVTELSGAQVALIQRSVLAGAGLLVTLGDQVPADAADWLADLLPVRLAGLASGPPQALRAVGGQGDAAMTALRADLAQHTLPALAEAHITHRRLLRPDPRLADWTVLRYGDGAPALLVAPRGQGRVAVWTTSVDRDWHDLPMHPGWLPLVRTFVLAAAGRSGRVDRLDVEVGEPVVLQRKGGATRLEVRRGDALLQTLHADQQPTGLWRIPALDVPGPWLLREQAASGARDRTILVHPPAAESAPALLTPPERSTAQLHGGATAARPLVPVWSFALVVLFALLIGEAVLLRRTA